MAEQQPCTHEQFECQSRVSRSPFPAPEGVAAFILVVKARCASCHQLLYFEHLPMDAPGLFQVVSRSLDNTEVRLYGVFPAPQQGEWQPAPVEPAPEAEEPQS